MSAALPQKLLSELLGTALLLAVVMIAAYIGAAYWFTASTSFANPAVTFGRIFSDSFAGIAPASAPAFMLAQFAGAAAAVGAHRLLGGAGDGTSPQEAVPAPVAHAEK